MATLSNGTLDILIPTAWEKDIFNIEKSVRLSAGGKQKTQTLGRRYKAAVEARVDAALWLSILEMMTDQSEEYYYTPTVIKAVYLGTTFPIKVSVTLNDPIYDSGSIYYIRFDVAGVDLL